MDYHTIELKGKMITARYFVIATGSSPFVPPIKGINDVSYITNMQIFSLDKLPESLVVIGAGPIGMEMAQSFHRLGSKVTVVETTDCILPREDKDISCYVHELLEQEGINFIVNASNRIFHGEEINLDEIAKNATTAEINRVKGLLYDK